MENLAGGVGMLCKGRETRFIEGDVNGECPVLFEALN